MGKKKDEKKKAGYVSSPTDEIKKPEKKKNPFKRAFSAVKKRFLNMKTYQRAVCVTLAAVFVCGVVVGGAFIRDGVVNASLFDNYEEAIEDGEYSSKYSCAGVSAVESEISYAYAAVEMFALYMGEDITEESLSETYGDNEPSSGKFVKIFNEQFPKSYSVTAHKSMTNSEALAFIYKQVKKGLPVPVELASKTSSHKWVKNYALVYAVSPENDDLMISIANTLGERETIYVSEFFMRTSFRAYENMSAFTALGFAFGAYSRNTFYEISRVTSKS